MKTKGFIALLLSAIIFASFGIWVRLLNQTLLPFQQIGFRNFIALIIALGIIFKTKPSLKALHQVKPVWLGLYSISFTLAVVFYTLAILQTKIVTTIFALYLGSLVFSLILGVIFFKEKLNLIKILSLILVFIGLVVYAAPNLSGFLSIGTGLALLSGFFDAIANSMRKFLSNKLPKIVLVVLQMLAGLAIATVLVAWNGQFNLPALSLQTWLVGLIFGLSLVGISYLTLIGFSNFDLNLGTVVLASELFFASIFSFIVFHEISSSYELLGGAIIILATFCAQLEPAKVSNWFNPLLTQKT